MIVDPPSEAGALNEIVSFPLPAETEVIVGAVGKPGYTICAVDFEPVPTEFTA